MENQVCLDEMVPEVLSRILSNLSPLDRRECRLVSRSFARCFIRFPQLRRLELYSAHLDCDELNFFSDLEQKWVNYEQLTETRKMELKNSNVNKIFIDQVTISDNFRVLTDILRSGDVSVKHLQFWTMPKDIDLDEFMSLVDPENVKILKLPDGIDEISFRVPPNCEEITVKGCRKCSLNLRDAKQLKFVDLDLSVAPNLFSLTFLVSKFRQLIDSPPKAYQFGVTRLEAQGLRFSEANGIYTILDEHFQLDIMI